MTATIHPLPVIPAVAPPRDWEAEAAGHILAARYSKTPDELAARARACGLPGVAHFLALSGLSRIEALSADAILKAARS